MQYWNNIGFTQLAKINIRIKNRKKTMIAFLAACLKPLQKLHDETLYTMQHDGRKIYLEKILNDYFEVFDYDPSEHETTKKIYIENTAQVNDIFIFQPAEDSPVFLEPNEIFIHQEDENLNQFSFTIFIPDTYIFNEQTVRALIDKYRFIGKLYNIETYTL